jgi:hypothetical protein
MGHDTQVAQISLHRAWSHGPPHLPGSPIRWHTRRLNRRPALNPYECHPRAAHATVHIARPRATLSHRLWSDCPTRSPAASPPPSPRVPPGDGATIPGLGGGDGYSSRWRRAAPTVVPLPWYLVIVARTVHVTVPRLSLGPEATFAQRLVSPEAAWIGVGMACTAGRTVSAKRRRLCSALCRGMPP